MLPQQDTTCTACVCNKCKLLYACVRLIMTQTCAEEGEVKERASLLKEILLAFVKQCQQLLSGTNTIHKIID